MTAITIRPATGTVIIRAEGNIIGETARALELSEGSRPPVLYIPREDVAMAFLERSTRHTTCPYKGEASYFTIVTPSARLADSVWSYEDPKPEVAEIARHLAFYTDRVVVERR
jgi:uncharacterized protein (DUF427 family)